MAQENNTQGNAYVSVRRLDRFWEKIKAYYASMTIPRINVRALDGLDDYTKPGEYILSYGPIGMIPTVCLLKIQKTTARVHHGAIVTIHQTVWNEDKCMKRMYSSETQEWSDWETVVYASRADLNEIRDLAYAGL